MNDDLISRQKVLDVINLNWEYRRNCIRAIEKLPSVNPQEPKWIPVSEMLPEERKAVLVYAPEYHNIYCAYLDGDTWFIFGGYGSYAVANVIAWMPLPEPYKAESEDKE